MPQVLDRHTIGQLLRTRDIEAWGVAANVPALAPCAPDLPFAVSLLMHIDPAVVRGLRHGPTADYAAEYHRLNAKLDEATGMLVAYLRDHGRTAEATPATMRGTDGDGRQGRGHDVFPHKTAATRAGLGWIGKTALFVSPDFGPAVRLATVFTDLQLPLGTPVEEGECGDCRACVDACPAGCGRDVHWRAGMELDELFDAGACRHHMDLYTSLDEQICGICIAACPLSRR